MRKRRNQDPRKKWGVLMSLFIALIMVMSVFGVLIGSYSNEIRYGKHKFTITETMYETKLSGKTVSFYTLPQETIYLNFSNATRDKIFNAPFIVTTFNPNTANLSITAIEVARFDLANEIGSLKVYNVVSEYSDAYASLPVVTCENATIETPLVIFNVSDKIGIVDNGVCIYFNGAGNDFLKIRDLLLYSYYKVI